MIQLFNMFYIFRYFTKQSRLLKPIVELLLMDILANLLFIFGNLWSTSEGNKIHVLLYDNF